MEEAVYKLDRIYDDPRYGGFAYNEYQSKPFALRFIDDSWQAPPLLQRSWKPTGVKGRVRPFNDFPCLMSDPAFSRRAVHYLSDLLEPNGELIPFDSPTGTYYAYNVATVLDALDVAHSDVKFFPSNPERVLRIYRFELFPQVIGGCPIFKIPQRLTDVFVCESFVTRVRECRLKGFAFYKVWPLATGTDWKLVALEEKRRIAGAGLPAGQTADGNSVFVEFERPGQLSEQEEKRRFDEFATAVDQILVDNTSDAPQIGDLDSIDYIGGVCRFTFCCPSADALVEHFRRWRSTIEWPKILRLVKRYGSKDDSTAREEEVGS